MAFRLSWLTAISTVARSQRRLDLSKLGRVGLLSEDRLVPAFVTAVRYDFGRNGSKEGDRSANRREAPNGLRTKPAWWASFAGRSCL
jgi:hypothetical protein